MSQMPEDGAEKSFEPTQKKLDDARRRGELARSTDLNAAAGLAGLILAFAAGGAFTADRAGAAMAAWLERAASGGAPPAGAFLREIGVALAPVLGLPLLFVVAAVAAQRGFVFAPEKLTPKLSRISPVSVAKNRFGRAGLFEFAKSAVKLFVTSAAVGMFLLARRDPLVGSLRGDPGQVSLLMGELLLGFLGAVLALTIAIAAVDYLWQVAEHRRKNMMTHRELTEESRQTEGDPHMKRERRQRGQDIATNRMLNDVPGADVVVVNPSHFAVALRWNRRSGRAPVCVAKGVDEIAARIRETAQAAGVPIHRDPPCARALHASVDIGQEIRPEHYEAVAAAIRFAEAMRRRARARQA